MAVLISVAILPCAPSKEASIRLTDFTNFSIPWDDETAAPPSDWESMWHWLDRIPKSRIRLTDGLHHFYKPSQSQIEREHSPILSMDSVAYGDLDDDSVAEAAVHLNYTEGGPPTGITSTCTKWFILNPRSCRSLKVVRAATAV